MFVDCDREGERQMAIRLDFIVVLVLSDEGFIKYARKDRACSIVHFSNRPYNCIAAVTETQETSKVK
jgi:hypothetical protein